MFPFCCTHQWSVTEGFDLSYWWRVHVQAVLSPLVLLLLSLVLPTAKMTLLRPELGPGGATSWSKPGPALATCCFYCMARQFQEEGNNTPKKVLKYQPGPALAFSTGPRKCAFLGLNPEHRATGLSLRTGPVLMLRTLHPDPFAPSQEVKSRRANPAKPCPGCFSWVTDSIKARPLHVPQIPVPSHRCGRIP